MSRGAVVLRASFFLPYSFAWAGAINVLPQLWLLQHHPERRHFLLSMVLLLGTACAIGGILLSQRQIARGRSIGHPGVVGGTLAWLSAFVLLLRLDSPGGYVSAYCVFRLASNWLFNHLDHAAVEGAAGQASTHVSAALVLQLLGTASAPAFFALLHDRFWLEASTIALLAIGTAAPALAMPLRARPPVTSRPPAARETGARAVRFHAYTFVVLASASAFATQLVYLLRDVHHQANAEQIAGALLAVASLAAAAAAGVAARVLTLRNGEATPFFAGAPLVFALGIAMFARGSAAGVTWLALAFLLTGLGYGAFLAATRLFATSAAAAGDARTLSVYNNMPNVASLGAYALTAVLSLGVGHDAGAFAGWLLALMFTGFLVTGFSWLVPPFARERGVAA